MVEFGKTLAESRKEEWSDRYLDYEKLKAILKRAKKARSLQKAVSDALLLEMAAEDSTMSTTTTTTSASAIPEPQQLALAFQHALDKEIEKVVLFLLEQQGSIARDLSRLAIQRESCSEKVALLCQPKSPLSASVTSGETRAILPTSSTEESDKAAARALLEDTHEGYRRAAEAVLDFVAFVELNVTAVRKILKKHDKNAQRKLGPIYLRNFTEAAESHLDQLYHHGGLSALVATLATAFSELHQMKKFLSYGIGGHVHRVIHRRAQSAPDFHLLLDNDAERGHKRQESFFSALSSKPSTDVAHPHESLLDKIRVARSRLRRSTEYVELVAAQALLFDEEDNEGPEEEESKEAKAQTFAARASSFLNLCSTAIYMMNYYVVAPTTGQYAARLGSTEAMAGIIIGMTPNAALIATVLYGWWSNHSYKSALVFAATSSLIGNIFYAMALKHNSLAMVMVGRFLNGFGSARSINRRFIADTFSRSERTAASAAFVTAGGIGMATGPAIAAVLGRLSFSEDSLLWTVETAPGWVMLTLWSVFIVATIVWFEEPDRSHLFGTTKKAGSSNSHGESKPLLSSEASLSKEQDVDNAVMIPIQKPPPPLYTNIPVMLTLWLYFVLKLILECLLSSCATLTRFYFGWDSQHSGTFLAILGLLMFPANMAVAKLASRYEDRELILGTLFVMLGSILGIVSYRPNYYSPIQYVIFGVCVFLSTNVLEGPNMSLLSKVIPKHWAKGIFNSGFLATEAGTAARSVGDVMITAAFTLVGLQNLLNGVFIPVIALVVVSILLIRQYFEQMIEDDDDDDDSSRQSKTNTTMSQSSSYVAE